MGDALSWQTIDPSSFRDVFPREWCIEQDVGVIVLAGGGYGLLEKALTELKHPSQHVSFEGRRLLVRDAVFEAVQRLRYLKLDEALRSRRIDEVGFSDMGALGRLLTNRSEKGEPNSSPSHTVLLRELFPVAPHVFGHEVGHTFFYERQGGRLVRKQEHNEMEELFCEMFSLSWLIQKRTENSPSNYVLLSRLIPLWHEEREQWHCSTAFHFRWWDESWKNRFVPLY